MIDTSGMIISCPHPRLDEMSDAFARHERDEALAEVAKLRAEVERLTEECRASDCVNDMLMRKEHEPVRPISVPCESSRTEAIDKALRFAPSMGDCLIFRPEDDYIGRLGGDRAR